MKKKLSLVLAVLAAFTFSSLFSMPAAAGEVPRMAKENLKALLGKPDVIIVDVRIERDWEASGSKIKGAVREAPKKADSWGSRYDKNKTYVLYCA
jgi:hypothetical protein